MPDSSQLQSYAQLLKLEPIGNQPIHRPADPPDVQAWRAEALRLRRASIVLFAIFVVAPTLLAVAYFGFIAADRYVSEARFVLRTPATGGMPSQLGAVLQGTGIGRATDDAYAVREYILSRDAVAKTVSEGLLPAAWDHGGLDIFWRFPNFLTANNREKLYQHYERMVSVIFDSTSGVSTLRVQAFTAPDAQRLAATLLGAAENLVNRLNERARRDAVAAAEAEVVRMEKRISTAQERLTAFRNREALVDPAQATLLVLEGISKLSLDAAQLNMQLAEIRKGAPRSPQLATLESRLASIEAQIAIERRKLAGDSDSVANKITEYETLTLEREFSERALMAALGAVELARLQAQRQQVYLERVAEPSLPDHPSYPYRVLWCLAVAVIGYMCFRIARIVLENLHKHASA